MFHLYLITDDAIVFGICFYIIKIGRSFLRHIQSNYSVLNCHCLLNKIVVQIFIKPSPFRRLDNIAPVVTFSSDSTSTSTTGNPRFSWTSDEPADFDCAIQGVTDFEKCGNGTSGSWTGRNVPDGKRTFLVRAQDPYGNENDPYTLPFEVGMFNVISATTAASVGSVAHEFPPLICIILDHAYSDIK